MRVEDLARSTVGGRAQSQGITLGLAAQVEVAVAQAGFLAHLTGGGGGVIDLERQRSRLVEDLEVRHVDLDLARGEVRVGRALRARLDDAGDLDAVLGSQIVGALSNLGLAEDDLGNTGAVAQIDKDHSAVVATAGNPARQRHGLTGQLLAKLACQMGTQH